MNEKKLKASAVIERFYVERVDGTPVHDVRAMVDELRNELKKIGDAFLHNVSSVISTMGIPVTLANAAARMRLWTQVLAAERVRALGDDDHGSEDSERRTMSRAHEHMDRHMKENGGEIIGNDMCDFLLMVHDQHVSQAIGELHGQGIVLLWSAVEVLARDLFVHCLNCQPDLVETIIENESTKRLFQLKGLDFEVLSQHRFDVSHVMGDILVRVHDLGNLTAIKACFGTLFPDDVGLRNSLADKELWLLSQRRNLIVHRRGIIDKKYVDSTGESLSLGTQISISSADLERSLDTVCTVGVSLMKSCADKPRS